MQNSACLIINWLSLHIFENAHYTVQNILTNLKSSRIRHIPQGLAKEISRKFLYFEKKKPDRI